MSPSPSSRLPSRAPGSPPSAAPLRHPRPRILVHWLTVLVLLGVFGVALGREALEDKAAREAWLQLHRALGLLAGLLGLARLLLSRRWPLEEAGAGVGAEAGAPAWQRPLSLAVQLLMVLLLLALPLLGGALTNARGQAVILPGLGALPPLLGRDLDLADVLEAWHEAAGWALAGLIGLHVGAALWHHVVRRDHVLAAMWPGLRPRR